MFCQIITPSSQVQLKIANFFIILLFQTGNWAYNSFFVCVCVCVCVCHVFGCKSHRQWKNRYFICVESFKTNNGWKGGKRHQYIWGRTQSWGWCICGNEPSCVAHGCLCLHYLAKLPSQASRCYLVAMIHRPLISIRLQCDWNAITIR